LSTKIHAAVDALGNPLRWRLTGGQVSDITQAQALVEGFATKQVIADKGYDSMPFIATIEQAGAQAIIPPRKNRRAQRAYDRYCYRERHLIECSFNRLKQFRRIATRYDKLARNYLSLLDLVGAYIWTV
jgi:transposase